VSDCTAIKEWFYIHYPRDLCIFSLASDYRLKMVPYREQGWRSGESTRLPPMWPGFKSRRRRHVWVEFVVGSLHCSERFFSGYSGFPLSSKTNTSKFQFDLIWTLKCSVGKKAIYIFFLRERMWRQYRNLDRTENADSYDLALVDYMTAGASFRFAFPEKSKRHAHR